ncbi:MAG: hypothetical protein ABI921_11915 [Panacibacter sp.]
MQISIRFKISLILLFIVASFLNEGVFAQTPGQQIVKTAIEQNATYFPQERIYIQFDKPAYSPGETVWYKAYLLSGNSNSLISANFYIDFTDADGNTIKHIAAPIIESSAKGDFLVPASYAGKSIHARAYTRWMLNFDSSFLYNKDILIIQSKQTTAKTVAALNKPAVQFFAEGGDCIAGINNKIAFKAIYPSGKPCNLKGIVVNEKGKQVADLKCIHDGMGYFNIEPQHGETFTAKWKDETGASYETPLPVVKKEGVSLEIKIVDGKRGFLIKRSENAPANFNQIHIMATMQQHLVYMASVKLDASPVTGGSIPVADLPSGILQVTLFDSNWVAFAERITFVNNDDYHFEPEVGFAALGTGKRGRNILVINVPDSIQSNLSVSVTDAGIGTDSSDDIISHLLLTGDLKGNVFHPSWYFANNSDSLAQQLDLVMLTNGWRRIKWDDLVQGKMPVIKYPNDTAYFSLSGKVFGASPQDLQTGAMLLLILDQGKDTTRKSLQTYLRKDGSFNEPNLILYDTTKVYYRIAGTQELADRSEVSFNNNMLPGNRQIFFDKKGALYFLDSATENRSRYFAEEQARIAKLLQGNTLAGVTVKAKTKSRLQILDETYATGLFTGGNSTQFDILNDPGARTALNVLTYLQGKVAGLQITASNTIGSQASITWRGGTPSLFLDEMPIDISQLSNMNMTDVAYVKVFQPPFFGAFGGGSSGAIAVYTQKGGNTSSGKTKSLPYKQLIGYTTQKEFYSPNYGTFNQRNDEQDLRSTLYWNPMILTTKQNHIIKLPFYNNDISHSFRVIVEGVSKDGQLTRIEKLIE